MQRYWFKPKRYGFGAAPATWQGWALTGAYVAALVGLAALTGSSLEGAGEKSGAFVLAAIALTLVFLAICWRTTEGGWRWRWGDKD